MTTVEKTDVLVDWFKKAAGTNKCTVKIEGTSEKGTGYVADIFFAKIILDDPNENGKEFNLVAKVSKEAPISRNMMADVCQREVMFYKEVVPILQKFQQEKNMKDPFESLPKCYTAFITEETEVIIQENLKTRGFELHDRKTPLNLNHLKLALKTYAKYHAISLALSDQKPDLFEQLSKNLSNLVANKLPMFEGMYEKTKSKLVVNLKEAGRQDLAERYEKLVEGGIINMVRVIFSAIPEEGRVITHSDCHIANMMFKYKDANKENPSNMVLLDFQLACIHSPMIDVSLFVYCAASKKELAHFDELMEFYYKELSSFLSQLGSDANKLFPKSTMWEHWNKYSFHGFNVVSAFLELLFVESDNAPEITDRKNENDIGEFLNINLNNNDRSAYLDRLEAVTEHYLNYHNI